MVKWYVNTDAYSKNYYTCKLNSLFLVILFQSFCGAIEMSGFLDLKCTIIKDGMKLLPVVGPSPLSVNPIFEISPLEPRYSEWLVFEGVSVDEQGKQHYLDATIAYKRAVLNCIKYLAQFGYSEEQVYLLLSCCPCEGRISGIGKWFPF